MLGCLPHTVRKQAYGPPHLLTCYLDLSAVSSAVYLCSYLTSVPPVRCPDPLMESPEAGAAVTSSHGE